MRMMTNPTGLVRLCGGVGLVMAALMIPLPTQAAARPTALTPAVSTSRSALAHTASLPLAFEPNRGQTDSRVRFLAHAGGSTIFLTERGIVLVSARLTTPSSSLTPSVRSLGRSVPATHSRESILQLLPVGASTHARIVGSDRLPGIVNYITEHVSHTNIPTYADLRYVNIYPGIDLALHGAASGLEYDWILKPGADAAKIALRIRGASSLRLDTGGNLMMRTALGTMVQERPVLYQLRAGSRRSVAGGFRLSGSTVRLWVGGFDHHLPLIVDPTTTLLYSTYVGGSSLDEGYGIAVDSSGDSYITGITFSSNFPICPDNGGAASYCASHTGSPVQATFTASTDAFVTELNPSGTEFLYSTYLGASYDNEAYAIAVDASGDAYVTGLTDSPNFPLCPDNGGTASYCASHTGRPVQSSLSAGSYDAFIAKLNPTGTKLIYSTFLGGSDLDVGQGIAVDTWGDAYVTGITESSNFPICPDDGGSASYCASHTGSPVQATPGGSGDAFVTELNPGGTQLFYSTYLGGSGPDVGKGIAVDGSGDAYVAGSTAGTFPICPDDGGSANYCASHTGSAPQSTFGGGSGDAFVAKLNSTGTQLLYSTYLGGNGQEGAAGIAVDGSGNAYVTGTTNSTNFPICPDSGGSADYCASHIGAPVQSGYGGGSFDVFITKINSGGSQLLYSTYLGGNDQDYGQGIAVDSSGDAYVTGVTSSSNFPICPDNGGTASYCASHTGSPVQSSFNGGEYDAFVAALNPTGTTFFYSTYLGGSSLDEGDGVAVDSSGDAYVTGVTSSSNFPVCPDNGGTASYCASHTGSPVQPTFGGASGDAFVTKLSPVVGGTKVAVQRITFTEGTAFSGAVATFTDGTGSNCSNPPFTVTINWGDGTTTTGTLSGTNSTSGCTVSGTHTYAEEGMYTITVSVTNTATSTMGSGQQMETVQGSMRLALQRRPASSTRRVR